MARRPHGEGSVYQAKNGKWVASISFTDRHTGKRKRRRKHARTKTEAVAHLKKMQETYGNHRRLPDDKRTMKQAVEDYAAHRKSSPGISGGTHEKDDWMRSIVLDGLGNLKTTELTLPDCELFLRKAANGINKTDGQKRRPIQPNQLKRLRRQLINILDNEMRLGLLDRNVAYSSLPPAKSSKADKPKTVIDLDHFETLVNTAEGSIEILIEFVGRYGMRPAEARAARWNAVDFVTGIISITEEMDKQNKHGPVKTPKAMRSIQFEANTIERLNQQRARQDKQRAILGDNWIDLSVMAADEFGDAYNRFRFNYQCKKLCAQIDIPTISPYDLRHAAISYQAERGHSAWEIADWSGTSEKMVSDVYRHQLNRVSKLKPI